MTRRIYVDSPNSPVDIYDPEWVRLNVGGCSFLTKRVTLEKVPDTLLSELNEDSPHYHHPTGQYLIDRNPDIFQYILDFYRTGQLHFPHSLCGPNLKKELLFWGIDESFICSCCWTRYFFSQMLNVLVQNK